MELGRLFENRCISTEKVFDIDVCISSQKLVLFPFSVVSMLWMIALGNKTAMKHTVNFLLVK